MTSEPLATRLQDLLRGASKEVLLISPFVKAAVFARLLESVARDVSVTVFTRWKASEVASGVSDLGVGDIAWARPNTRLFLCDALHAKAYIVDEVALVGSANLTGRALGWSAAPNVELLVETAASREEVRLLLEEIREISVIATEDRRAEVATLADAMARVTARDLPSVRLEREGWVPQCANPNDLYRTYVGRDRDPGARHDLDTLGIPDGLAEEVFRRVVSASALETRLFECVNAVIRRNGRLEQSDIEDIVSVEALATEASAGPLFMAVCRWMEFLRPAEFRTQPAAVVLVPGRQL